MMARTTCLAAMLAVLVGCTGVVGEPESSALTMSGVGGPTEARVGAEMSEMTDGRDVAVDLRPAIDRHEGEVRTATFALG